MRHARSLFLCSIFGLLFLGALNFSNARAAALSAADSSGDSPQGFCVQTFNTYGPVYAKHVRQRTLALTRALDSCAMIQLQEVWRPFQKEILAQHMPSDTTIIDADRSRSDKNISGLVGLVKGSIQKIESALFTVNGKGWLDYGRNLMGVRKGFLATEVLLPQSRQTIVFLNLHLHHSNQAIRLAQLVDLMDWYFQTSAHRKTVILAGDFNATPDSLEMELLQTVFRFKDSYREANRVYQDICTYCKKNPMYWGGGNRVIDYILFADNAGLGLAVSESAINLKYFQGIALSDHYGVKSNFAIQEGSANEVVEPPSSIVYRQRVLAAHNSIQKVESKIRQQRDKKKFSTTRKKLRMIKEQLRSRDYQSKLHLFYRRSWL